MRLKCKFPLRTRASKMRIVLIQTVVKPRLPPCPGCCKNNNETYKSYVKHTVTCRSIDREGVNKYISWDKKLKDVDSWKPSLCCGINRRVHGYERSTNISLDTDTLYKRPWGGGVEYLHRSPASRRRRRKWKSRIWKSKIWSWVPRDSNPRMTALASTSSNCKRQTRPLVRDRAPHQQTRNGQTVIKIWS
jgi:hypothetical protein